MAQERTYQAQVDPREGAALPMRSAREFGAGIGDQLADAGDQMHRRELRAYQLDRQETAAREAADFDHRFALARQNLDDVRRKLRSEAGPGGAGHVDAVGKVAKAAEESLFAGITEEEVLRRARGQWQDYATRLSSVEGDFAEGQRVAKQVLDDATADNLGVNRIGKLDGDPDAYAEELRIARERIFGAPGQTDADRQKRWMAFEQRAALAFAHKVQETNPMAGVAMVESGLFDHLDPQVVAQLRDGFSTELRVRANEEARAMQRAETERRKAAEDAVEALEVRLANGDVPGPAEIAALQAEATEAGVSEAKRLRLGYATEGAAQARAWRGLSTKALIDEVKPLREAYDDGELDAEDERRLKRLEATIEARGKAAGDELVKLPPAEQADRLRDLPRSERAVAAAKLGNRAMILGSVNGNVASTVLAGAGVREARPDAFMPPAPSGKRDPKLAEARFNAVLGPHMLNQLGEAADEVREAALDFYAGVMSRKGAADSWNEQEFQHSIRAVYGGTPRAPGVWQGGIAPVRGKMTELPDEWTAEEFDREWSRMDLAAMGAVYADGKPVNSADVRANYRLVVDGEDDDGTVFYRVEAPNGRSLRKKDGAALRLFFLRRPQGGR